MSLPSWPPSLTSEQLSALTTLATTYALSHGLLYLPVSPSGVQPPAPQSAVHAPLALFPSPLPRKLFNNAKRLQRAYNVLYARIAMDVEFLDRVMGAEEGAGKVDEFTGKLWKGWKGLRDEGLVDEKKLHLGLFRSDYLVHAPDGNAQAELKQVEFNTISSSFGTLSDRAAALHRYLFAATGYFGVSDHLRADNLPPNDVTKGLATGLAAAHAAYGVADAVILFVVQDNERNVFDQRWLDYELLETHNIRVVRQTFAQLATTASLSTTNTLHISLTSSLHPKPVEISTIYFRAGYTPTDYPTPQHYQTRMLLEQSRAVSCPSVPLQLAGGKKVQAALARPGVLERFLSADSGLSPDAIADVRKSWVDMWLLEDEALGAPGLPPAVQDAPPTRESAGVQAARARAAGLVLKPQREGGGNNVYKAAIPAFLDGLPPRERAAWVAMALIQPPEKLGNYLVRAGAGVEGAVRADVVSELGIFGWTLFGGGDVKREEEVGWLVRTKGRDSDEGGVAAGFSVLDSVLLVD